MTIRYVFGHRFYRLFPFTTKYKLKHVRNISWKIYLMCFVHMVKHTESFVSDGNIGLLSLEYKDDVTPHETI